MTTPTERFWLKVDKRGVGQESRTSLDQCWTWLGGLQPGGYGWMWFQGRPHLAHRVAWFLAHGEWPNSCALHRCDNRKCVNPGHLFEGSRTDNNRDRMRKGRSAIGERSGRAKLNQEKASEIIARKRTGETAVSIARDFGISGRHVAYVGTKTWVATKSQEDTV